MLFFLFSKFFIFLIYSEEFYSINNFLVIAMLSMFIKAISEPLRYLLLSKDKKYQFFFSELFYNLLLIGSTLIGYLKFGLLGVSIGLVIVQVVYAVVLLVINHLQDNLKLIFLI
jgi:O-antigen/teichoic acid export membrane protein